MSFLKDYGEYRYTDWCGRSGNCGLHMTDTSDGRTVVMCTNGSTGPSVTNCAESIATKVCNEFRIPVEALVWVEHYRASRFSDEHWSLVTFRVRAADRKQEFADPEWRTMTESDWCDLGLEQPGGRIRGNTI